jgi:hypothetical protein
MAREIAWAWWCKAAGELTNPDGEGGSIFGGQAMGPKLLPCPIRALTLGVLPR